MSSTEAEYIALTEATKEATWLKLFMSEICPPVPGKLTVYADNQCAIALSKNPEFHKQTKQICLRYHYVCKAVDSGVVQIPYVPTADMAADKALAREKHDRFRTMLGVLCLQPPARGRFENDI